MTSIPYASIHYGFFIEVKVFVMNNDSYYWLFQPAWNVNRLSILPIQLLYCISILLLQTFVILYRMRKLKERYGITDFRKHANRMTFGEVHNSISCINTLLLHMYMCVHMPDWTRCLSRRFGVLHRVDR